MRFGACTAVLLAAVVTAPVGAQPESPPTDSTIVVTGKADMPAPRDTYEQARDISRVSPHELYERALPRFVARLCPGVLGFKAPHGQAVANRIRENAARLRLPLANPGCSPNLLVAVVEDGQTTLAELERKQPGLFRLVSEDERRELLTDPAPVRVWNNIAVRWAGNGSPPNGWPDLRPSVWGQLDRKSMPEAWDIRSTLVLFDGKSVIGLTLMQLADYATMRGLTHTRPPKSDVPDATILQLFDDDADAPASLTRFDSAYLRSLYQDSANRPAVTKLLRVSRNARRSEPRP